MPLEPGTRLGRYEVLSPLGAGGMGEVYRARDARLGRDVAVKVLREGVSDDPSRLQRFQREARAAGRLNHPNLLAVHDVGLHEGVPYVVSELLEGETLRHRLAAARAAGGGHDRPARLPLSEALEYAIQVGHGLRAAHEKGIVHRDVKPENIFLRSDGFVKLLDFGLAKLVGGSTGDDTEATPGEHVTNPGAVMGTACYMSPEQASGLAVDARTDVFSLGVVLYEMVAGALPFRGETPAVVIAQLLTAEPVPLDEARPDVPPALARVAARALEKRRGRRYADAREMVDDLEEVRRELERAGSTPGVPTADASGRAQPTGDPRHERTTAFLERRAGGDRRARRRSPARSALAGLALVVVGAGAAALAWRAWGDTDGATIDSLAVLPLANDTGDADAEFLCDGITESLINSLSRLPNVRVMSRNAVFRYKGSPADVATVAGELRVGAVLTGRIARYGDTVSVSVELVDARDRAHLWGEQYTRRRADVLAIQDDIAREITETLRPTLAGISGISGGAAAGPPTRNPRAYELYLRGRFHWNKRTGEGIERAIGYFDQAIAEDPAFALAHAGLADAYIVLSTYTSAPPSESLPKAEEAARRALALDDGLAEAHTSLAAVHDSRWEWPEAEAEFRRAVACNPNYATAHQWYADHLSDRGRAEEAIAEAGRALELDPFSLIANTSLGGIYFRARDYARAEAQFQKTLELDPSFASARTGLGHVYVKTGRYDEAVAIFEESATSQLGYAYGVAGRREEAGRALAALEASGGGKPPVLLVAMTKAAAGDRDGALAWLGRAYADRRPELSRLKADPRWDALRGDPRFEDLVMRVEAGGAE